MAKKKAVKKGTKKKATKKAAPKEEVVAPMPAESRLPKDLRAFGYSIPKGYEAQKKNVLLLKEKGEEAQKHLGVLLAQMQQDTVHLTAGEKDFTEFARKEFRLSKGTVNNCIRLLEHFNDMGAPLEVFPKIGPAHIHQMHRAYKTGAVTTKGVLKLLPMATTGDPKYLTRDEFKEKIDKMLGKKGGETGKPLKSFAIKPDTGEAQEVIQSCLSSLKTHPELGQLNQSQVLEKALVTLTAQAMGEGATFETLRSAYNYLAAVCPDGIAPVLVVTDQEKVNEALVETVAKRVISKGFIVYARDQKDPKVLLTTDAQRAAKVMEVEDEQIREFGLEVDPAILPKTLGSQASLGVKITPPEAEEGEAQEESAPEPAKKGGKKKAAKKKAVRRKKAEPSADKYAEAPIGDPQEAEEVEEAEETEEAEDLGGSLAEAFDEPGAATKEEIEKIVRDNLKTLRQAGAIEKQDFTIEFARIEKEGGAEMTDLQKFQQVLEWTRTRAKEKGVEVQ